MLPLQSLTAMMAARCEYQMRANAEYLPGLWSLHFATQVNHGISMSWARALRRSGQEEDSGRKVVQNVARLYHLLWDGHYRNHLGHLVPIRGDISKLPQIVELSTADKALVRNYHFLSARIAGTRQI